MNINSVGFSAHQTRFSAPQKQNSLAFKGFDWVGMEKDILGKKSVGSFIGGGFDWVDKDSEKALKETKGLGKKAKKAIKAILKKSKKA